ncbi:MAG: hypothetical protein M3N04_08630 [Actinomycetota bacterium]|nr:hypothetical protein [Actinomycetota bacterium]
MTSTERLEAIAAMYVRHDNDLHRLVMARGSQNPQIVDDACAHGWTQLVAGEHIDLRPPRWQARAYVTTCALRHAWLLNRAQQRARPTENSRVTELVDEQDNVAGADELVALGVAFELVARG